MNKFFTRIVGAALGLAMAIGVGVAIKSISNRVNMVDAASGTYTMTIDSSANGSNNVHWTSASTSSLTHGGITWNTSVTGTTSVTASTTYAQIGSKNNPATNVTLSTSGFAGKKIISASLTGYCMTNTGPALTITANSTTMLSARDLVKTTSTNYDSTTGNVILGTNGDSAKITFTISSSAKAAICISQISVQWIDMYKVTYQANGGTGNDYVVSNITSGGTHNLVTFATTGFSAPSGKQFKCWSVSSTERNPGYSLTVSADTIVLAVWEDAAASGPNISLSLTEIEGFTGETYNITATYSSLESAFAWGTPSGQGSITGSVKSTTGTNLDGTSTYSAKLTGEGSVSLSTSGGGVSNPPSVSFSITQTTVNIVKASASVAQGGSETLEVSHNASSVNGLTWTSNNSDVEVDSNGKVTVAIDAEIGSTATITATSKVDESVSDTCVITVKEKVSYNLLTSAPNDWRGTYLIVNTSNNTAFDGSMNNPGSGTNNKAVTISGSSIDKTNTTESYVVKIERNLTDSSKYSIKTNSGLYIGRTEGTSGGALVTTTSVADAPANDISFSNDVFTITCGTYHLRYNTTGYFRYYTSASQQPIQLYKLHDSAIDTEVSTFITSFYSATDSICENYDTNTASSFTAAWGNSTSGLTKAFNDLSVDAQGVFANTTYTVGKETKGTIEDLADRYDYIISKYSTLSDFMGRKVSNTYENNYHSVRINVFGNSSNESITSIIVIIVVGFAALIAVSGFLYISKRKQR